MKHKQDKGQTDRRSFLAGAGKCGALALGATYLAGMPVGAGVASAQSVDTEEFPVEEKDVVRLLGVVQRRGGLTKRMVSRKSPDFDFSEADQAYIAGATNTSTLNQRRPTPLGAYYNWVYTQVAKGAPGPQQRLFNCYAIDGAFGDATTCMAFVNRDQVTEATYAPPGAAATSASNAGAPASGAAPPAARGARPPDLPTSDPTPPDSIDSSTALNILARQVQGHGTRPSVPLGSEKVMYFLKMSAAVASDSVKAWQTLHDRAIAAVPTFMGGLQGSELLQRLPNTAARQSMKCGGAEIVVPDLVAVFWSKNPDGGAAWENYVRSFRLLDKEKVIDPAGSFFLVVQEFRFA